MFPKSKSSKQSTSIRQQARSFCLLLVCLKYRVALRNFSLWKRYLAFLAIMSFAWRASLFLVDYNCPERARDTKLTKRKKMSRL